MEKAIICALDLGDTSIRYKMDELKNLANACDIEVIYEIIQKAKEINNAYYVGSGKVDEIKMAINTLNADIVIFNNELSPAQIRNLEKKLDCKIIDKTLLILDIFAKRANTKESILEVELAQLKYMLPRLVGLRSSLSRQGGGFNAKGPGEKKIELDRRHIEAQIYKLKQELSKIIKDKEIRKNKRLNDNIPLVALVGYTNAGKSATMNTLINQFSDNQNKDVFEKNMLFATLNTSVRRLKTHTKQEFLLSDTVGFVSDLPHHLVNSFKSTLDEIKDADLLLHVVDISNPFYEDQIKTTNECLADINANNIETIYVFTKADLLENQFFPYYENSILISNKTNQNIDLLVNKIKELLFKDNTIVDLFIPYEESYVLPKLENIALVYNKNNIDNGILAKAELSKKLLFEYSKYIYKK